MAAVRGGVSAPECTKEKGLGRMRSSPRTHFGGLFGQRTTGEEDGHEGVELGVGIS